MGNDEIIMLGNLIENGAGGTGSADGFHALNVAVQCQAANHVIHVDVALKNHIRLAKIYMGKIVLQVADGAGKNPPGEGLVHDLAIDRIAVDRRLGGNGGGFGGGFGSRFCCRLGGCFCGFRGCFRHGSFRGGFRFRNGCHGGSRFLRPLRLRNGCCRDFRGFGFRFRFLGIFFLIRSRLGLHRQIGRVKIPHHNPQIAAVGADQRRSVLIRPGVIRGKEYRDIVSGLQAAAVEPGHSAVAVHVLQALAFLEALGAEAAESFGQMDIFNILAAIEGSVADLHQSVTKIHGLQPVTAIEAFRTHLCHTAGEHHMVDFCLILLPGTAVLHFAAAADGKGIVFQLPGQTCTAATAGGNGRRRRCQHHQQQTRQQNTYNPSVSHMYDPFCTGISIHGALRTGKQCADSFPQGVGFRGVLRAVVFYPPGGRGLGIL